MSQLDQDKQKTTNPDDIFEIMKDPEQENKIQMKEDMFLIEQKISNYGELQFKLIERFEAMNKLRKEKAEENQRIRSDVEALEA